MTSEFNKTTKIDEINKTLQMQSGPGPGSVLSDSSSSESDGEVDSVVENDINKPDPELIMNESDGIDIDYGIVMDVSAKESTKVGPSENDSTSTSSSTITRNLSQMSQPITLSPAGTASSNAASAASTSGESEFSYQLCMARPVRAETFCDCVKFGKEKSCKCGEDDQYFDWVWDEKSKSPASQLIDNCKEVIFHLDYSCGTAAVRGNKQMVKDQYFWEVKMTSPVYGTDMMIGVGTEDIDLNKYQHKFCSLIGQDTESWGLSYTGATQHRNRKKTYSSKFGQGSIIGAHLDMWRGTLAFYKNRKPLGIAYTGLQGKILYPIVSSTAARSGMKVITSRSFKTSLQFMCCQTLRRIIPHHLSVLDSVTLPPGLREFLYNNISWLLEPSTENAGPEYRNTSCEKRKQTFDEDEDENAPILKKSRS